MLCQAESCYAVPSCAVLTQALLCSLYMESDSVASIFDLVPQQRLLCKSVGIGVHRD